MSRKINDPAFNKGYEAYFDIENSGKNPYPENSKEHDLWIEGWETADADSDDN